MIEQKIGNWSKDPNITKNWSKADYFINNREIKFDSNSSFSIVKIDSVKNTMILLTLYALFDLTKNSEKNYFNFDELRKTILKNYIRYKVKLNSKGKIMTKEKLLQNGKDQKEDLKLKAK